jgi:hypothetical protein
MNANQNTPGALFSPVSILGLQIAPPGFKLPNVNSSYSRPFAFIRGFKLFFRLNPEPHDDP